MILKNIKIKKTPSLVIWIRPIPSLWAQEKGLIGPFDPAARRNSLSALRGIWVGLSGDVDEGQPRTFSYPS